MAKEIKKVAVLGAGVMGSGISAHLANCGIPCYMLDIVPKELNDEEKSLGLTLNSPEFRNRFARLGLQNALKAKPALFYSSKDAKLITVGNFEDNMEWLKEVDWIIEVVTENLEIKRNLYKKVLSFWKEGTIVTSNTSGISIKSMMEGMPEEFKKHFFVTHFFNPVRYMKLLEIISGEETDRTLLNKIVNFGSEVLGKGIVYGKDTPNFVANRIGVYSMMSAIHTMIKDGYTIEEVDAIAGPPMGRPKSAAFRTADLVGIDTLAHVAKNVYETLIHDDEREIFKLPEFMEKMIERKWLGDKTKQGFYKVEKKEGEKEILAIDYNTMEYRKQSKVRYDSLGMAKNADDVKERIKIVVYSEDRAGQFAWKVLSDTLIYAAKRIPEIADDIVNIDNAMKWGFNWELGPFETWDAIGVKESVERMEKEGKVIPEIVKKVLETPEKSFYKYQSGKLSYFDFASKNYVEITPKPTTIILKSLKDQNKVIKSNMGASLIDIGDGVACLEFHTKMNAIDGDIISMMNESLDEVEKNYEGLVIANQAENFSVGANLMLLWMESNNKNWPAIDQIVKDFQNANMRLRYSPKPVVAAPHGMALGGGCEVALGADRIRAAAELYMGLVEVGVGLIPAGGGTKEMLLRYVGSIPEGVEVDLFPYIRRVFEIIGMAKFSMSAKEAKELGFLKPTDQITVNKDRLIYDAKQTVLAMVKEGYVEPTPRDDIRLPGESAYSALLAGLYSFKLSGMISDYDEHIGKKLAYILTGGKTSPKYKVSEQYILDLEREAFLSLCGEQKTLDRMQHMLMKGKPLRN